MKHSFKIFLILFVLVTFQKDVKAQLKYLGFGYSTGLIYLKQPPNNQNDLFIRSHPANRFYKGVLIRSEDPDLDIGIGLTSINIEREIQGVFPETNLYGFALINTNLKYWTIPITVHFFSRKIPRISLSYIPSFIAYSKQTIQKFGGATESDFVNNTPKDFSPFQHSLIFSLNTEIGHYNSPLLVCINPYVGICSDYFKDQKPTFLNVMAGIGISISFDFTSIDISRTTKDNPNLKRKEEELRKKQEEIQKKLNKK